MFSTPNPILTTVKHPDIWFVYDTYHSDHHSTMDGLENRQTVIQLRVKIIIDHTSGVKFSNLLGGKGVAGEANT